MACGQKSFSTTVKTVMLRLGFSCQAPLTDPWAQCCLHDHCRARRYATPRKVRTDFGISTTGLERQIQASVDKRPGLRAFRQTLAWWDTELPESVMSYWTPNQSFISSFSPLGNPLAGPASVLLLSYWYYCKTILYVIIVYI